MARPEDTLRAFLAIELSDEVRASLAALIDRFRKVPSKVSWVPSENLHLTLRFLGDIDRSALEYLADGLAEQLQQVESFRVTVQGVGAFPTARRPGVVWAAVARPPRPLMEAQALVEKAARAAGLDAEGRDFVPHITLGRVRNRRASPGVIEALDREKDFEAGEFAVRSVSLFSSELTPHAAIHRKLKDFPLKWTST